jgi:hypothetical protein
MRRCGLVMAAMQFREAIEHASSCLRLSLSHRISSSFRRALMPMCAIRWAAWN